MQAGPEAPHSVTAGLSIDLPIHSRFYSATDKKSF